MSDQYKSLNHVPRRFQSIRASRLTLEQINAIVADAREASSGAGDFAHHFGKAKGRFTDTHKVVNGAWVSAA